MPSFSTVDDPQHAASCAARAARVRARGTPLRPAVAAGLLRSARRGLALAGLALVAGCGFHLQGVASLPPALERTYVETSAPHSVFLANLTDTLRGHGVELVPERGAATAVLRVSSDTTGQRVLSVSARNIPREYEVFYTVTFSLQVGGETVIADESLAVTRSYTFDETQVLAMANQEEVLRRGGVSAAAGASAPRAAEAAPRTEREAPPRIPAVVTLGALAPRAAARLAARYGAELVELPANATIPGSYWGATEAGLVGRCVYVRADTPVHSLLHELAHFVCMDAARRARLDRDAGGDDDEECAVCYLEVLLAEELPGFGRTRCLADMDAWGYSFREGGAAAWFAGDGAHARAWLRAHALVDAADRPTFRLRA